MARRRSSRFVRPASRTKMWIGKGVGQTVITASTKHLISTLSAGALALRPFTILRTRMLCTLESDQTVAIERPTGSLGSIVVTDTAAAIGVTAVPDPSVIAGAPEAAWFAVQQLHASFIQVTSAGFEATGSSQYEIDDHSMRKVSIDDDVVMMFTEFGAGGARLFTMGRTLIQLH